MAVVISRNDPAFDEALLDRASVAFGVFDGVHEGHRFIIGEAVNTAREEGRASAVITFDIDPDEVFAADRLKKLMTNEARIAKLAELDVDAVVVLPFSREFAAQSPEDFLDACFGGGVHRAAVGVDGGAVGLVVQMVDVQRLRKRQMERAQRHALGRGGVGDPLWPVVEAGLDERFIGLRKLGDADARLAVFGKDLGLAVRERAEVRGGKPDGPVFAVGHNRCAPVSFSCFPQYSTAARVCQARGRRK